MGIPQTNSVSQTNSVMIFGIYKILAYKKKCQKELNKEYIAFIYTKGTKMKERS